MVVLLLHSIVTEPGLVDAAAPAGEALAPPRDPRLSAEITELFHNNSPAWQQSSSLRLRERPQGFTDLLFVYRCKASKDFWNFWFE